MDALAQTPPSDALAQTIKTIDSYSTFWQHTYWAWYSVFVILCVIALVLPLIIAAGVIKDAMWTRILGLITAICVAVLSWGNIGIVAGNYNKASEMLLNAKMQYPTDQPKLAAAFKEAGELTDTGWPTLLPQASITIQTLEGNK
jgi:hypothetical protein